MDSWTMAYGPVHSPPWTKTKGYEPLLIWAVGRISTEGGARGWPAAAPDGGRWQRAMAARRNSAERWRGPRFQTEKGWGARGGLAALT